MGFVMAQTQTLNGPLPRVGRVQENNAVAGGRGRSRGDAEKSLAIASNSPLRLPVVLQPSLGLIGRGWSPG